MDTAGHMRYLRNSKSKIEVIATHMDKDTFMNETMPCHNLEARYGKDSYQVKDHYKRLQGQHCQYIFGGNNMSHLYEHFNLLRSC